MISKNSLRIPCELKQEGDFVKITTLIENNPDQENSLCFEHGLSMLIETEDKKILFDTGKSGDFLKNAETLCCDMKNLDYLVISHGHYDHSGGVTALLKTLTDTTTLVVGASFFEPKYRKEQEGTYRFNGNSFQEKDFLLKHVQISKITKKMEYLTEQILIFSGFEKSNDFEKTDPSFCLKENNVYVQDNFQDEIVMGTITKLGLVVITGCSHAGIVNILDAIAAVTKIPIYAVIGGTHLIAADDERIEKTIKAMKRLNIKKIAVSHCTGETAIYKLKDAFGADFIVNHTGNIIII